MAWRQVVSDIPMNDWSLGSGVHAVSVGSQVYLFGCNISNGKHTIEALAFNPDTYTWRAQQSPASGEQVLEREGTSTKIHFAVACKEKVYVCFGVGGLKVFDTQNWQWSCANTSGDGPFATKGSDVRACEVNGHVYVCDVTILDDPQSYIWTLDLSTLQWEIVNKWDGGGIAYYAGCLLPYENRLYVVLHEWTGERMCEDYEIRHFDLATRKWEDTRTHGEAPKHRHLWMPFIHRENLYTLLIKQPEEDSLDYYSTSLIVNESVMYYSFATKAWRKDSFEGDAPPDSLDAASVVNNKVVFFSFEQKKTYVLAFFP